MYISPRIKSLLSRIGLAEKQGNLIWHFLPSRNFIFFPKDWLKRTGLIKSLLSRIGLAEKQGNLMWRFLPPRNFIFFPKSWLIRTSLDKKFVESFSSGKKIGKIDRTLLVLSNFYLFLQELAHYYLKQMLLSYESIDLRNELGS